MLNVICLKHGKKYSAEYVNNLYRMVQRHLTVPHRFICFTERPKHIDPKIEIMPLPNLELQGWWYKPYFFKADLFPYGDVNLFLDLDTVIIKNIDKLITYEEGHFVGLQDPSRIWRPEPKKLGSAIMRWRAGTYGDIWTTLESNQNIAKRFAGDQNYIWDLHKDNLKYFPHHWIMSYKWEVRSRSDLIGVREQSRFKTVINPRVHNDTAVFAFHGFPMVHDVKDPIIVDNWC